MPPSYKAYLVPQTLSGLFAYGPPHRACNFHHLTWQFCATGFPVLPPSGKHRVSATNSPSFFIIGRYPLTRISRRLQDRGIARGPEQADQLVDTNARHRTRSSRFWNMDFSLQKETKITERTVIQLSADAFNLLNRTNFARPIGRFDSSLFGRLTAITGNPRLLQLGARFIF